MVSLLNKHFSASSSRTSARAHVRALKALRSRTAGLKKLEEAVWSGRSADEWVVGELQRHDEGYDMDAGGEEVLKGTKVASGMEVSCVLPLLLQASIISPYILQAKAETLRSFAVGQITEGFHRAISFAASTSSQHGVGLSIQSETALQPPRSESRSCSRRRSALLITVSYSKSPCPCPLGRCFASYLSLG